MTVNTTWVNPTSATLDKTTGNTIDETMMDAIASNFLHLGGGGGHIGARVYNSANISATNSAETLLTFNSERYDSDPNAAIHDTSSNTGRLVVRTAGVYHVGASVQFAANTTGIRYVALRLNGTTDIAKDAATAVQGGSLHQMTIHTVYAANATDYFEVYVFQNSGGSLNVEFVANNSPEFWMAKV